MARNFVFANPPFKVLAKHLAKDAEFLDDVRRILDIAEDAYLRLAAQLAKSDDFLDEAELTAVVGTVLGEDSDEVASIIALIGKIVHETDMDASTAMDHLAEAIEENAESLEEQERRMLTDRIRKLVAEPVGIAKQFKARQLVDAIGAELDDFRLICDIRPIFDQTRKLVDGAIPIATLRLEYTDTDSDSAAVEVRVTELQLKEFADKIEDAKLKLDVIKDLLNSQHVAIPRTKSTLVKDEV